MSPRRPTRSPQAARASIDLARVTRVDGTTTYFGSVLASGFDSKVNDRANAMRWPRGGSRYNIAILVEFLRLTGIPYEVELVLADGTRERVAGDLVMATVGNGRSYGGGIPICPDADPADGLLDVVLVRPAGRLRLLRLLPRVYQGTHADGRRGVDAPRALGAARGSRRDRLRGRRPDRGAAPDDRRRPAVAHRLRAACVSAWGEPIGLQRMPSVSRLGGAQRARAPGRAALRAPSPCTPAR